MKDNAVKLFKRLIHWCKQDTFRSVFVGIDPGSDGAIGLICGHAYAVIDIPKLKVKRGKGKKTVFNLPEIIALFRNLRSFKDRVRCVVEQPPPSMGLRSSAYAQFRLGCAYAMWPLFLMSQGFRVEEVSPHVWKKVIGIGSDKETSRHKALGMFPKAPLARKKDHNRAEALLLAEYHNRRSANGQQHTDQKRRS